MTREKIDMGMEKQIVTALATSREFLASAAGIIDPTLFQTAYASQLARWCLRFWADHAEAPGRNLETIFHGWVAKDHPKEEEAEAVSDFLEHLSTAYDIDPTLNVPHLTARTGEYLTTRKLAILVDIVQAHSMRGEVSDAVQAISEFRQVATTATVAYNPLGGREITEITYAEPVAPIIEMPGDAARFFGRALHRDSLIGVQGPEKRGKTWWCLEFVYRALRSRRKVAFFEVGDMSANEVNLRWDSRVASMPVSPCDLDYPVQISLEGEGDDRKPIVGTQRRNYPVGLNAKAARLAHKQFHRVHRLEWGVPHVLFFNFPAFAMNVKGIHNILKQTEYELGFSPDVLLIDYADILAPEVERKESRDQINETWGALRRLSQEWHACVIVPTQADAGSYDLRTQTMKNFSNDKRKNAHVTAMLGLNQTSEEKDMGVMRLNWILKRAEGFNPHHCLWVANCLPLGMAMVRSVW